jgi:hypothetical protein
MWRGGVAIKSAEVLKNEDFCALFLLVAIILQAIAKISL